MSLLLLRGGVSIKYMKKDIAMFFALAVIAIAPLGVSAQSVHDQYVSALTQEISLLEQEVQQLVVELQNLPQTPAVVPVQVAQSTTVTPSISFGSTQPVIVPSTTPVVCIPDPVMYVSTSTIVNPNTVDGEEFSVSWSSDRNNCGETTNDIGWVVKDPNGNIISQTIGGSSGDVINPRELQSFGDSTSTPLTITLTSGSRMTTLTL